MLKEQSKKVLELYEVPAVKVHFIAVKQQIANGSIAPDFTEVDGNYD